MAQNNQKYAFVTYLYTLADENKRGALADLRRGLTGQPGTTPVMYPYVAPWITEKARNRWEEKIYYLLASLFASYQSGAAGGKTLRTEEGNLGEHCQILKQKGNQSGSFETRFTSLLNSHPDDLPIFLRQVISLLKSNNIAINWHQLFHDLLYWNSDSKFIQRQWANSYWAYRTEEITQAEENKEI